MKRGTVGLYRGAFLACVLVGTGLTFLYQYTQRQRAFLLRADRSYIRGDSEKAFHLYKKSLDLGPDNPAVLRRMVSISEELGRYDIAYRALEDLIRVEGESRAALEELGDIALWRKDYGKAVDLYRGILSDAGGNKSVRLKCARALQWAGRYEEASLEYDQLLAEAPEDLDLTLEAARTALWGRQYERAIDLLEAVAKKRPDDVGVRLDLISAYAAAGKKEKASGASADLMSSNASDADYLKELIKLEVGARNIDLASDIYKKWLDKHPEDQTAKRRFAELLRANGKHAEAWPFYRDLIKLYPEDRKLLLEASEEAIWAGEPGEAIPILEKLERERDEK